MGKIFSICRGYADASGDSHGVARFGARKEVTALLLLVVAVFVFAGCSGATKSAVDDAVTVPVVTTSEVLEPAVPVTSKAKRKVAVLPFRNFTENQSAAEIVTDAYVAVLFSDGKFAVEEPGNVRHFIIQEQIGTVGEMDIDKLALLGRRMNVDAVIVGNVEMYDSGYVYGSPIVSIYARMIDTSTGKIIWAGHESKRGDDYAIAFEIGTIRTPSALATKVVSELVETIAWQ